MTYARPLADQNVPASPAQDVTDAELNRLGLCAVCEDPHPDESPGECRLAAERARAADELAEVLTELGDGAAC